MKKYTFDEYQKIAHKTADYSNFVPAFIYLCLGIAGETGEVVEKIKKIVRNNDGKYTEDDLKEIEKELGDVLWYISELANEFNIPLSSIANTNLEKVLDRKKRKVIKSKGDNR
jgi:NTP pyrophosphatase (non-canonical NTP hydrolase)